MGEKNKNKKQLPSKTVTRKKVKVLGMQEYIDTKTGEIVKMAVTEVEERDFNFGKIWLKNFVSSLELVGNKKTSVAYWIIDHLDKQNRIVATVRKIADETNTSVFTVSTTMKVLQEADFLRLIQSGVYQVNPEMYFKGTHDARMNVLTQYHSVNYEKPILTKEEKIATLKASIAELEKQLCELETETVVEVDPQLSFDESGAIYQTSREVEE